MFRRLATWAVLVVSAASAAGQSAPQLHTVFPPGAKAGDTVEVTVTVSNLDSPDSLLFSDPRVKAEFVAGSMVTDAKPRQPQPGTLIVGTLTTAKFKVKGHPELVGLIDVRVVGKNGLSNPRTFAFGRTVDVVEKEPNSDSPDASTIEMNTTINGNFASPTDVDYVSVKAKAGENVVVSCLTTSIDSRARAEVVVISPDGKSVASNRGYRDDDAVLDFLPASDGDYLIRISQFAYTSGGPDHFYRLTVANWEWVDAIYPPVGPSKDGWTLIGRNLRGKPDPRFPRPDGRPLQFEPLAADSWRPAQQELADRQMRLPSTAAMIDAADLSGEDGNLLLRTAGPVVLDNEKNDTADAAQVVSVPCDVAGRIEKKNDRDWYSFEAKKGDVWTLEVFADRLGSPVDAYFILTDEKGKAITEQDDGPDSLSPNQLYTKSDDPGRYRFVVPADGKFRVMVSTREATIQFGPRDQYVLRVAKETPDFRLVVMPDTPHYPEGGTVPGNGAALFNVYVFRFDGFAEAITLTAVNLPPGVKCPPQVVGPGQTRGRLVLTADKGAAEWAGFVTIKGTAGRLSHAARPFSVVWRLPGLQPNQAPPNTPVVSRMDRGGGLALAVRGDAPFRLTAKADGPIKVKAGERVEFTLRVERAASFKDPIVLFSQTPNIGPQPKGNNPLPPLATVDPGKDEVTVSLDVPNNLPPGTYSVVVGGRSGAPLPKGQNVLPHPNYPATPVTIVVEGKESTKKK